ncbi:hypothetical protein AC1031_014615 [Aphanomyces cochlioides]|nr:hypothetical protein AC1031_014615 [Aphanomyces cochlioides]
MCGKSSIEHLLDWLSVHDGREYVNYTRWRGGTRTKDGVNKMGLVAEISQMLLREHGISRNADSMKSKIQELNDSYSKARDFMTHTGEGVLSAAQERLGNVDDPEYQKEVLSIREKRTRLCKYWDTLDEIIGDRASVVPVFRTTNEASETITLQHLIRSTDSDADKDERSDKIAPGVDLYNPDSPPETRGETLKKKLKLSSKKPVNLAETIVQGMQAQAQVQATFFEHKRKQDTLEIEVKQREIHLKERASRHAEVLEQSKLMASLGYSKEEVMEYLKDRLARLN